MTQYRLLITLTGVSATTVQRKLDLPIVQIAIKPSRAYSVPLAVAAVGISFLKWAAIEFCTKVDCLIIVICPMELILILTIINSNGVFSRLHSAQNACHVFSNEIGTN